MTYPAGVLTVSDGVFHGTRADKSGDWLAQGLGPAFFVQWRAVVPDERDQIEAQLRAWVRQARLVVTTGGTGLGPRDVTPEAVRAVITREVPGMAEAMRVPLIGRAPHAMLSRQVVGACDAKIPRPITVVVMPRTTGPTLPPRASPSPSMPKKTKTSPSINTPRRWCPAGSGRRSHKPAAITKAKPPAV